MNVILCENIDALLVYSALEQFTDSPVFQTSFPIEPNVEEFDFFFDTSLYYYELLLDNFYEYFECIESNVLLPSSYPYPVFEKESLQFLLEIFQQDIANLDAFFERSCYYKNLQEDVFIPNVVLEFANIDTKKSVYHFLMEREDVARSIFEKCLYEYQDYAPYAAESLLYQLKYIKPSYDELWYFILDGVNTGDRIFYLLILRDMIEQLNVFRDDFIKENGWYFENEFFKIYEEALNKKREWYIPFDLAFGLAFKEYLFNKMYVHVVFGASPESFNFGDDVGRSDFIDFFHFSNMLFSYFIKRNLYDERIMIIQYLMENHCEDGKKAMPFCFWRYNFPYLNTDETLNSEFMGPLALTGSLYCQTKENNNYLAAIYDACFNDLLKLEEMQNPHVPVIIFSMGRLYVFTIFSSFLFLFLYLVFCFKLYIVVPNLYQMFFESIYSFVFNIVSEQAGILAIVHFPLVFSIFNVILCGNIVGLIPYGFTVTSHLTFTFSLGLFVFIGIVLLTILNKRIEFFRLFIPTGVPKLLVPLLCVIEVISYVFRVVSLSVRLFANMMAGHALLHILLGFVPVIFNFKNLVRFLFIIPIVIIIMITLLEIGISLLQSYVFIVLISIYLRDCYGGSAH